MSPNSLDPASVQRINGIGALGCLPGLVDTRAVVVPLTQLNLYVIPRRTSLVSLFLLGFLLATGFGLTVVVVVAGALIVVTGAGVFTVGAGVTGFAVVAGFVWAS